MRRVLAAGMALAASFSGAPAMAQALLEPLTPTTMTIPWQVFQDGGSGNVMGVAAGVPVLRVKVDGVPLGTPVKVTCVELTGIQGACSVYPRFGTGQQADASLSVHQFPHQRMWGVQYSNTEESCWSFYAAFLTVRDDGSGRYPATRWAITFSVGDAKPLVYTVFVPGNAYAGPGGIAQHVTECR